MRYFQPSFIFGSRLDNELTGTDGPDLVFGFAGNDRIETRAGNDFVNAGKGDDLIDTGAGDDIVFAGKGDDVVRLGAGNDTAFGGKGFDTALFAEGIGDYEIEASGNGKLVIVSSDTAVDGGRNQLRQFEALHFEGDDYTLYLDGRNNAVLAGDDVAQTGENEVLTLQVADLLANDRDFDGDTISLVSVSGTSAAGAAVTLSNGTISYDPGTLFEGLAAGETATDTFTYVAGDGKGGNDTATVTITITGEDDLPAIDARINEFHYDNVGIDAGEFVEIRVASGDDASGLMIELLNGSGGTVYDSIAVAGLPMTSDGTWDYYVWNLPANGIQNGSPDGIVLANGGQVIEFLSYEGEFVAANGAAAGMRSTDVGVSEPSDTPLGQSLQREEDGSWAGPRTETAGAENLAPAAQIVINEIMQNPAAVADAAGEWFEVLNAGTTSVDMNGWTISDNGTDAHVIDNGGPLTIGPGEYLVFGINADMATNGGVAVDYQYSGVFLANGDDEVVLSDTEGNEIDRVEYDGGPSFPDPSGASMALSDPEADNNVGANWTTSAATFGDGDLGTPGADNGGDTGGGEELFIWQVQGSGFASPYATMEVTVDAIVTYTKNNGFFLQEEDAEADGDATTSDGIFVFTGTAANLPSLGDRVSVTGAVTEFFGETQIASVSNVTIVSGGNPIPTPAQLLLGPDSTAADKEAVEGMYFELMSGTVDPITVITNFNFDRFGEIYVSAGNQYQPTQLFDAQTQAAEVQALLEDNLNNRLKIDDGLSIQNPTEFAHVANTTAGDNGNGILDAGDAFSADGPTLRLGSEFDGPARGVMTFAFGDYTMLVDGTLPIDPATNEGARQATPDDVGGTLQVGAFNVLNYFTTLSGNTVGPDNLSPRGATTAADLERQTTKIVEAMAASGIDVFALQEIENNGFGPGSASATLAGALGTATGESFAVVDPTGGAPWLGTDAISNSIMYDTNKVTLVDSAFIVFEEGSAATTFALADALADLIGGSRAVGDFQRNRPAVVATFEDAESGEEFTVASVHFKSKGASGLDTLVGQAESYLSANAGTLTPGEVDAINAAIADLTGDANYDQGDGQGFWNGVRTDAAGELYGFLTTSYGGGGVSDYVILGDFNAYTREDPTQAIGDQADTVDLLAQYVGPDAYSFVFDGQRGALDQVMASSGLADHVTGLAEWHINAVEPDLLNYSSQFNDPRFYSPDLFASSDHDPVILGLDFSDDPFS